MHIYIYIYICKTITTINQQLQITFASPQIIPTPKSRFTMFMVYVTGRRQLPLSARAMQQPPPLNNHLPRQTTLTHAITINV